MSNYYKCNTIRLCRYLYGLGFDKTSMVNRDGKEYWLFEKSEELTESLDFFFYMRKKLREK